MKPSTPRYDEIRVEDEVTEYVNVDPGEALLEAIRPRSVSPPRKSTPSTDADRLPARHRTGR